MGFFVAVVVAVREEHFPDLVVFVADFVGAADLAAHVLFRGACA